MSQQSVPQQSVPLRRNHITPAEVGGQLVNNPFRGEEKAETPSSPQVNSNQKDDHHSSRSIFSNGGDPHEGPQEPQRAARAACCSSGAAAAAVEISEDQHSPPTTHFSLWDDFGAASGGGRDDTSSNRPALSFAEEPVVMQNPHSLEEEEEEDKKEERNKKNHFFSNSPSDDDDRSSEIRRCCNGNAAFHLNETVPWKTQEYSKCLVTDEFVFTIPEIEKEYVRYKTSNGTWSVAAFALLMSALYINGAVGSMAVDYQFYQTYHPNFFLAGVMLAGLIPYILFFFVWRRRRTTTIRDGDDEEHRHGTTTTSFMEEEYTASNIQIVFALIFGFLTVSGTLFRSSSSHYSCLAGAGLFSNSTLEEKKSCIFAADRFLPGSVLIVTFFLFLRVHYVTFLGVIGLVLTVAGHSIFLSDYGWDNVRSYLLCVSTVALVLILLTGVALEHGDRICFKNLVFITMARDMCRHDLTSISQVLRLSIPPLVLHRLHASPDINEQLWALDRSPAAIVTASAIADFHRWCTSLMPKQVVLVLHQMAQQFDQYVKLKHLDKIQMDGDAFFASSGLLSAQGSPRVAEVLSFSAMCFAAPREWYLLTTDTNVPRIRVRVTMGELWGQLSGTNESRYIVGGNAFDAAYRLLKAPFSKQNPPVEGILVQSEVLNKVFPSSSSSDGYPSTTESEIEGFVFVDPFAMVPRAGSEHSTATSVNGIKDEAQSSTFDEPALENVLKLLNVQNHSPSKLKLNLFTLQFADEETGKTFFEAVELDQFTVAGKIVKIVMFVGQLFLPIGFLLQALVTSPQPLSMLELVGVFLTFLASLIAGFRLLLVSFFPTTARAVPKLVDGVLLILAVSLSAVVPLFCLPGTAATTDLGYWCLSMWGALFIETISWGFLSSLFFIFVVTGVIPLLLVKEGRFKPSFAIFDVVTCLVIIPFGHSINRFWRSRFVLERTTILSYQDAAVRANILNRLLHNILPSHTIQLLHRTSHHDVSPAASSPAAFNPTAYNLSAPLPPQLEHLDTWDEMVVILIRLNGVDSNRVQAWDYLSHLTQTMAPQFYPVNLVGDEFLACGPLQKLSVRKEHDAALHQAVLNAVKLSQYLMAQPGFTIALALSDGYGAAFGTELLSYNVFGPAARTAALLLSAAPVAPVSYAVATEGVRLRVEAAVKEEEAVVSTIAPELFLHLSQRLFVGRPSEATVTADNSPMFHPPQCWAVRGGGCMRVSPVKQDLSIKPPSTFFKMNSPLQ